MEGLTDQEKLKWVQKCFKEQNQGIQFEIPFERAQMKHILDGMTTNDQQFSNVVADELFDKIEIEQNKSLTIYNVIKVITEAEIILSQKLDIYQNILSANKLKIEEIKDQLRGIDHKNNQEPTRGLENLESLINFSIISIKMPQFRQGNQPIRLDIMIGENQQLNPFSLNVRNSSASGFIFFELNIQEELNSLIERIYMRVLYQSKGEYIEYCTFNLRLYELSFYNQGTSITNLFQEQQPLNMQVEVFGVINRISNLKMALRDLQSQLSQLEEMQQLDREQFAYYQNTYDSILNLLDRDLLYSPNNDNFQSFQSNNDSLFNKPGDGGGTDSSEQKLIVESKSKVQDIRAKRLQAAAQASGQEEHKILPNPFSDNYRGEQINITEKLEKFLVKTDFIMLIFLYSSIFISLGQICFFQLCFCMVFFLMLFLQRLQDKNVMMSISIMSLFCFIDQLFKIIGNQGVDENVKIDGGLQNGLIYIVHYFSFIYFLLTILNLMSLFYLFKDTENILSIESNFFQKTLQINPESFGP